MCSCIAIQPIICSAQDV